MWHLDVCGCREVGVPVGFVDGRSGEKSERRRVTYLSWCVYHMREADLSGIQTGTEVVD